MYTTFAFEFGWGPERVERLTLQQMEHYLYRIYTRRQHTREPDTSLELLRRALFSFFKIPEPQARVQEFEQQARKVGGKSIPLAKVTETELATWEEAGMPSPFIGWLRSYRDGVERGQCNSQVDSGSEEVHAKSHEGNVTS